MPGAQRIPRRPVSSLCPLSFAQERLWFLDQFEPGSAAYNLFAAVRLRGRLEIAILEQSLNEIVRRHESLRTTFTHRDGRPLQIIAEFLQLSVPVLDLGELPEGARAVEMKRLAEVEASRPFDLERGPLLRLTLLRLEAEEHVALFTIHHIISDGWSMNVLIREVMKLYGAFIEGELPVLPELAIQYADFAWWQREWLKDDLLKEQLDYWKRQLAGAPPVLELPSDRQRPEVRTYRGAAHKFVMPAELVNALKALSQSEGVTLFILLLAAFKTLLLRYTEQPDIVVGIDVANRKRLETEHLIGFFVNMLVMRTSLGGNPTFRELLGRVREVALGAYAHQDLPFDKLVEELQPARSLSVSPLFQVVFNFQSAPEEKLSLPGLDLSLLSFETDSVKFDLSLFVHEGPEKLFGSWRYSTELYDAERIQRLQRHFLKLLESIVAQPDVRLSALDILTEEEKQGRVAGRRERKAANFSKFIKVTPKARNLSAERLVKFDYLQASESLPLVIRPELDEIDLRLWAKDNRSLIEAELVKRGAILFRGFRLDGVGRFSRVAAAIAGGLIEYNEPSSPRTVVADNIYTSTDYPADQEIQLHNELSYSHSWPRKIFFHCVVPAETGGETPIAYSRRVFELLSPSLKDCFAERQVMYVRNFGDGFGLSWQQVFGTGSQAEMEAHCRRAGIGFEWKSETQLKTWQVRPAIITHPQTGEVLWFNQAHAFHVASLEPKVRQSLLDLFAIEDLPNHAYYGDGSPIEDAAIEEINEAYRQAATVFPWQQNDLLLVENMLVAHGRRSFLGPRRILVAMAEPYSQEVLISGAAN